MAKQASEIVAGFILSICAIMPDLPSRNPEEEGLQDHTFPQLLTVKTDKPKKRRSDLAAAALCCFPGKHMSERQTRAQLPECFSMNLNSWQRSRPQQWLLCGHKVASPYLGLTTTQRATVTGGVGGGRKARVETETRPRS